MPEPFGPMIAWTSPLPTVRSIPWRISWSGWPSGRDPQAADHEVLVGGGGRLVGHVADHGSLGIVEETATRGGDEVGEGHRFEGRGDRVADADPQDVDRAARRAVAGRGVLGVVGGAEHRRDRALEGAQDLAHRDGVGRPGQLVAAVGAARAHDEPGLAQVHDELLEVGARQVLLRGDAGEARRTGPVVARELDHQPHAVLALRGEGDGARAVVGGALGGLRLDGLGVAAGGGGQGGGSSISE